MTLDHAYKILPFIPLCEKVFPSAAVRVISLLIIICGRIAFPIFIFSVVNGCRKTSNFPRYLFRLYIFALISQPVFSVIHDKSLNVFFTLALSASAIYICDKVRQYKIPSPFIFAAAALISFLLKCDYSYIGIMAAAVYYYIPSLQLSSAVASLLFILYYFPSYLSSSIAASVYFAVICGYICAAILISNYNTKRGYPLKFFFYIYYPAHLIVLLIINYLV